MNPFLVAIPAGPRNCTLRGRKGAMSLWNRLRGSLCGCTFPREPFIASAA
jgi:hypothetical protein